MILLIGIDQTDNGMTNQIMMNDNDTGVETSNIVDYALVVEGHFRAFVLGVLVNADW